jgi:hypothetical protein
MAEIWNTFFVRLQFQEYWHNLQIYLLLLIYWQSRISQDSPSKQFDTIYITTCILEKSIILHNLYNVSIPINDTLTHFEIIHFQCDMWLCLYLAHVRDCVDSSSLESLNMSIHKRNRWLSNYYVYSYLLFYK